MIESARQRNQNFYRLYLHEEIKGGYALAKSTFDLLVQAGYPFEENDFVLLDDTTDPELKDLILNDENTFGEILPIGHDAEWS